MSQYHGGRNMNLFIYTYICMYMCICIHVYMFIYIYLWTQPQTKLQPWPNYVEDPETCVDGRSRKRGRSGSTTNTSSLYVHKWKLSGTITMSLLRKYSDVVVPLPWSDHRVLNMNLQFVAFEYFELCGSLSSVAPNCICLNGNGEFVVFRDMSFLLHSGNKCPLLTSEKKSVGASPWETISCYAHP